MADQEPSNQYRVIGQAQGASCQQKLFVSQELSDMLPGFLIRLQGFISRLSFHHIRPPPLTVHTHISPYHAGSSKSPLYMVIPDLVEPWTAVTKTRPSTHTSHTRCLAHLVRRTEGRRPSHMLSHQAMIFSMNTWLDFSILI